MSAPRVGEEFAEYRIESAIARGGMSTVLLVDEAGPLPPPRLLPIMSQLAGALRSALAGPRPLRHQTRQRPR